MQILVPVHQAPFSKPSPSLKLNIYFVRNWEGLFCHVSSGDQTKAVSLVANAFIYWAILLTTSTFNIMTVIFYCYSEGACAEVWRLVGAGFFSIVMWASERSSDHQAWMASPWPAEPAHWPPCHWLFCKAEILLFRSLEMGVTLDEAARFRLDSSLHQPLQKLLDRSMTCFINWGTEKWDASLYSQ